MTAARKLWVIGWLLVACAIYVSVIGQSAYLPVYLANRYLWVFAHAVALHRIVTIYKDEDMTFASYAVMYVSALICAALLARLAPTIGEPNYCSARRHLSQIPPHVFRCTTAPFAFVGFLAGFWISGWILMRLIDGVQSRARD